jgi:hypothetical protein
MPDCRIYYGVVALARDVATALASWPGPVYFASRIERGINRGPGAAAANEEGLAAAYQAMLAGSGHAA